MSARFIKHNEHPNPHHGQDAAALLSRTLGICDFWWSLAWPRISHFGAKVGSPAALHRSWGSVAGPCDRKFLGHLPDLMRYSPRNNEADIHAADLVLPSKRRVHWEFLLLYRPRTRFSMLGRILWRARLPGAQIHIIL